MNKENKIAKFFNKVKESKIILILLLIYNFVWAVCKIVFGVFSNAYYFCISGASTLLIGFTKKIYLGHYNCSDNEERRVKSITISILLIVSSILLTFYFARLFFVQDTKNYGKILSITIAFCSFLEMYLAIRNFVKARKTNDILLQTYRCCSLSSAFFAIVLTQVALLSAMNNQNSFYNALSGVIFGSVAILIGIYALSKSISNNNKIDK